MYYLAFMTDYTASCSIYSKYVMRCINATMVLKDSNMNTAEIFVKIGIYRYLYTEHCAACSDQTQTARVYQNADSSPSKHEDTTQCCFNAGPAPLAVGQY